MNDTISRQWLMECVNEGWIKFDTEKDENRFINLVRDIAPSAEPERLTDEDFETIRIHLNAYKEQLCNQHRWEEAEEYQRIIDRFKAFASAEPEIIHCKDCKFSIDEPISDGRYWCHIHRAYMRYCSEAERK